MPQAIPSGLDLFAGIAGAVPTADQFDLGHGVTLSKTYAHVFAPFLIAFSPPPTQGAHHPTPWKSVEAEFTFEIEAELYVPAKANSPLGLDCADTMSTIVPLLRLKATPRVVVPVVSGHRFEDGPSSPAKFWPYEMQMHQLLPVQRPKTTLDEDDLGWVRDHWVATRKLAHRSSDFRLLFEAFDQCHWITPAPLALVALWGVLERLFSPPPATIAAYLEPSGTKRHRLFKAARELYGARHKVAHGSTPADATPLVDSYALVKQILLKMIEADHVPSRDELEARVFGA